MTCDYCKTHDIIQHKRHKFMFHCKRCGKTLCSDHRIQELHECSGVTYIFGENYVRHELNGYITSEGRGKFIHTKFD